MKTNETCHYDNYRKLPLQIIGPITDRLGDDGLFEIVDGNGETQVWVRDPELARQVSGLLGWFLDLGVLY